MSANAKDQHKEKGDVGVSVSSDRKRGESTEWMTEILEALEARKEAEKLLNLKPRPRPPRGLMQRRQSSDHTQNRALSTTHTMRIVTTDKN